MKGKRLRWGDAVQHRLQRSQRHLHAKWGRDPCRRVDVRRHPWTDGTAAGGGGARATCVNPCLSLCLSVNCNGTSAFLLRYLCTCCVTAHGTAQPFRRFIPSSHVRYANCERASDTCLFFAKSSGRGLRVGGHSGRPPFFSFSSPCGRGGARPLGDGPPVYLHPQPPTSPPASPTTPAPLPTSCFARPSPLIMGSRWYVPPIPLLSILFLSHPFLTPRPVGSSFFCYCLSSFFSFSARGGNGSSVSRSAEGKKVRGGDGGDP